MRTFFIFIFLFFLFNTNAQTPRSGGINNIQSTVLNVVHDNFVGIQTNNLNAFAVYNFDINFNSRLNLKTSDNITGGTVNKYFTDDLARNSLSAGIGLDYTSGVFGLNISTQNMLSSISTKVSNTTTINGQALNSNITLNKNDIGLSNADNTSDLNKPISIATQTALNGKLSAEVDGSVTNEIQNLSITGNTISLSNGGGSVVVPSNNYTAGTAISIASNVITNTAPDQTVVLTAGNRISIAGTYPNFTISYIEPTATIVTRSVNSNFTISTTKQATVYYSVTCSVTNPLLVGTSTAMAYLEYSINAGSTWLLPSQNGNSSGVGLTVTLQLTNGQTGVLAGTIPANALVRIRTAVTGTGSAVFVTGQETY